MFIDYIEAWVKACGDISETPRVVEDLEHRLSSSGTHMGVTDLYNVKGCSAKPDLLITDTLTENTNSGYTQCTNTADQYKVDGMVMPGGDEISITQAEIKARSKARHTVDRLPPQLSLTRVGIIAKPPEESIRMKHVVVKLRW